MRGNFCFGRILACKGNSCLGISVQISAHFFGGAREGVLLTHNAHTFWWAPFSIFVLGAR